MIPFKTRKQFTPTKVVVESAVKRTTFVLRILKSFPHAVVDFVDDANDFLNAVTLDENKSKWQNTILLAKQRGPFLRYCPGTQKHICCMYYNLDVAAGCDLNCTYCVLQGYINNPVKIFYCNLDDMYSELDNLLLKFSKQFYRIGSGELSDSLTFDHFTGLGEELVEYFSDKHNAIIELKTKNVNIENLLGKKHNRRAVISWSMNSEAIWQSEESETTSLEDRLLAAKEIQDAGYRLGFHFDPMIDHENWQEGYRETVDKIFSFAKPENIAWISLGALRYPAGFEHVFRENHPDTNIYLGELLPGVDRKLRYFMPIRIEMFKKMYNWVQSYSKDVCVYLCMENAEVWQKSFGWSPGSSARLKRLLDDQVK
jgi:spore photoproduct lyase